MITLTEAAARKIHAMATEHQVQEHAVRVMVVGGGCSGLQYQLGFDDQVGDSDNEIQHGDVKLIVDDKSAVYLAGTVLDYVDSLQESGFKINNPNAKTTCGCGQSFGA